VEPPARQPFGPQALEPFGPELPPHLMHPARQH
jgi:hypothetical protein